MLVKMRTRYCSAERSARPGEVMNVPDAEARALVDGRFASYVGEPPAESDGQTELSRLGLSGDVLEALGRATPPITTIGALRARLHNNTLAKVRGIGTGAAEEIAAKLAALASKKAAVGDGSGEGGGDPAGLGVLGLDKVTLDKLSAAEPPVTTIEALRERINAGTLREINGIGKGLEKSLTDALAAYDKALEEAAQ